MAGVKKIPIEINGVEFPSVADACRHFGTPKNRYKYRVRSGWDRETAITKAPDMSKIRQSLDK